VALWCVIALVIASDSSANRFRYCGVMPPTAAAIGATACVTEASGPPGKVASNTSFAASVQKKTMATLFTQKCSGWATAS
jgi:hypothetical protein